MRTELQAQVEQKMGRNLLRYQLVEARLKEALPLRTLEFSVKGIEKLVKEKAKKGKLSLGELAPDYLAAFEALTPDGDAAFRDAVNSFVQSRNWLAHHLLVESNGLATIEDCRACMERLDTDYASSESVARHVMELYQFLVASIRSFLDFWSEAEPGAAGVAQACRRQGEYLASLYGDSVSVKFEIPLLEVLAEIMSAIEVTSTRVDGWVAFNPVGQQMHQKFPNVPPHLLSMAKQIDHYEFAERPAKLGAGSTWMFRRRRADS